MKHINVSLGFHFINLNIDKYNTVLSFERVEKKLLYDHSNKNPPATILYCQYYLFYSIIENEV